MGLNQFITICIQPERRLNIKETTQEMFLVSSLLYGGISIVALIAMLLPTWPELDQKGILITSMMGLFVAFIFYYFHKVAPLWFAILHIPFGIALANVAIYLGHSDLSTSFSIIFIIGSAYLFHYITKRIAIIVLLWGMILFIVTLKTLGVVGWPSIVVFVFGNSLLMGLIVWLMTRRMHQLNITDSLTGLINRQTIDAMTQNLLDIYEAKETDFVFIIIDLNKFKLINDTKGHLEGDKVLIEFGRHLKASVNEGDYVARRGGDEFIVILSNGNEQDIERFELSLRNASKDTIGFELGVSKPQREDTLDAIMHRADKNLYSNKHHRRSTD